jgi:hypothetical protein
MKTFAHQGPRHRRSNYEVNKRIQPFTPQPGRAWRWQQSDVDRAEFRKIECFCQTCATRCARTR